MFTGIIEARVPVTDFRPVGTGASLLLPAPTPAEGPQWAESPWAVAIGDSVAVSGCCLTVAELTGPRGEAIGRPIAVGAAGASSKPGLNPGPIPNAHMRFDLSAETLARTWFGQLASSASSPRYVNLERALCMGERLGGHLVSGHVDGGAQVTATKDSGDGGREIYFEVDPGLERYLIEKGSVTLDGVSLTVVEPQGAKFHVALIPLTLELTSLDQLQPGDRIHVEADLIGKWVEKLAVS